MLLEIQLIQHDATVLYNHLCSDDADRVYVDGNSHLQVDSRGWFARTFWPLGDSSRKATDMAAIRTLKRVLNALEGGTLDNNRIIVQERVPIGMFMDEDEIGPQTVTDLARAAFNPNVPAESSTRPQQNMKYVGRERFGKNISNASHFKAWMPCGDHNEAELTYEQKVCHRITILTQMILWGRDSYITAVGTDFGYKDFDQEI